MIDLRVQRWPLSGQEEDEEPQKRLLRSSCKDEIKASQSGVLEAKRGRGGRGEGSEDSEAGGGGLTRSHRALQEGGLGNLILPLQLRKRWPSLLCQGSHRVPPVGALFPDGRSAAALPAPPALWRRPGRQRCHLLLACWQHTGLGPASPARLRASTASPAPTPWLRTRRSQGAAPCSSCRSTCRW